LGLGFNRECKFFGRVRISGRHKRGKGGRKVEKKSEQANHAGVFSVCQLWVCGDCCWPGGIVISGSVLHWRSGGERAGNKDESRMEILRMELGKLVKEGRLTKRGGLYPRGRPTGRKTQILRKTVGARG